MSSQGGSRVSGAFLMAAVTVAVGASACTKKPTADETKAAAQQAAASSVAANAGLSETFQSPGKLITVHYPRDFTAEAPNDGVLAVSRELSDGMSEVLSFVTIAAPPSKDFDGFTGIASLAEAKRPVEWEYREVSRTKTTCNGVPGLNIIATWKPGGGEVLHRRWWCAFLRDGHGYAFSYNVPETAAVKDAPLLRSIIDATTFDKS